MKYVLRAWGELKRGFEVLALGEICFEGMGAVIKGVCVLALVGEMCFDGIGVVEKGVRGVGTWCNVF